MKLFLGLVLFAIGILMAFFANWKVWRSRWFAMGGLFNQKVADEKLALTATRFWGVVTAIAGILFLVFYFRK
ncbi:MAG TPA: hypothetical protein DHD79_08210 [Firmicutes bacterium]|nr:hypothetical protein [Bacillota bacterium]HAW71568.1 hypothetical protein [Bacillota bacterium]HBE07391.1 hypothetical protein [Bacillota bacterium]HBG42909.1 hypothetical protein [Bacillota bacterium]HBL48758.1 hypothetical protein [Bacillota bacterium]